ncbi:hypothetical protein EB796_004603 [Bugula neritina]|uniref:Uncharacterized protein n=1 Tax=Bugula neritina TaxID=10212 RepID=A0A7J7KHG2_BUGNE|nr:hypothetical protein EB796_004603 [Bugula neritina]
MINGIMFTDGVTSIEHSLDIECSVVMSQWCYDVTDWEATKSLFILNSDTGEFKQVIHHKKFTQLPDEVLLTGMCLVDGELWGAARSSGLLKFTIK